MFSFQYPQACLEKGDLFCSLMAIRATETDGSRMHGGSSRYTSATVRCMLRDFMAVGLRRG